MVVHIPRERRYVMVGGFPSNFTAHAVMHDIDTTLQDAGEVRDAVRFTLDDDDEEDDRDDEKGLLDPRTAEPAFRATDLDAVHDELDGAAGDDAVAVGYCTGGTVLADYQRQAHHDPDRDGFAAAVVLDAPSGIETDHQRVTVTDYPHDDIAGFYDADIPVSDGITVPRAVVPGTDHLWRDIPDDLGAAVYTAMQGLADGHDPETVIATVTSRYDGIETGHDPTYQADGTAAGRS